MGVTVGGRYHQEGHAINTRVERTNEDDVAEEDARPVASSENGNEGQPEDPFRRTEVSPEGLDQHSQHGSLPSEDLNRTWEGDGERAEEGG